MQRRILIDLYLCSVERKSLLGKFAARMTLTLLNPLKARRVSMTPDTFEVRSAQKPTTTFSLHKVSQNKPIKLHQRTMSTYFLANLRSKLAGGHVKSLVDIQKREYRELWSKCAFLIVCQYQEAYRCPARRSSGRRIESSSRSGSGSARISVESRRLR